MENKLAICSLLQVINKAKVIYTNNIWDKTTITSDQEKILVGLAKRNNDGFFIVIL